MTKKEHRERYAYLKRVHRCTTCGKQDERTLAGKIRCARCTEVSKKSRCDYRVRKNQAISRALTEYEAKARRMEEQRPCDYQMLALMYAFIRTLEGLREKEGTHDKRGAKRTESVSEAEAFMH